MNKVLFASLIGLLCFNSSANARTRNVLFVGNSYIHSNNIPLMIQQIANSFGDTLLVEDITPGGYTLQAHSSDAATIAKIQSKKWDVVVLQEQSQRPAFSPAQVASDTYPYAKFLDSVIRDNNSCTETMFYMTWGRKNGDASNCSFYPPICTYEGMQQRLRESYMQMAQNYNGIVAPVGAVWKMVRDSVSSIELYTPDESHPSVNGAYLAACVFYASIFHRSPYGSSYTSTVKSQDAERIQYFASKVVIDSIDTWQQHGNYTYTNFTYSGTSSHFYSFNNKSLYATNYYWEFTEGINSTTSTQTNPAEQFIDKRIYEVKLTASNTCFTEQVIDSIDTGFLSLTEIFGKNKEVSISQRGEGVVTLHIDGGFNNLKIYSINGSLISDKQLNGFTTSETYKLTMGTYIYLLQSTTQQQIRGKLLVR